MPGRFSLSNTSTLLRILCVFWLIAKIISYKVWLTYRVFPLVPVFDVLENIPSWIHLLLYAVSIISLGALIIAPGKRTIYYILFLAEIIAVLLDYTRWQPWEYQYLFILLIFMFNKDNKNIITAVSFIMIALYFYSGINKLNEGFLLQIWNNMLLIPFFKIPHSIRDNQIVFYFGYCIGIIETVAGISLLFKRTQKAGAILLILMHIFNLIWLGPMGINYNIIVWPWNCFMMISLYIIFVKNEVQIKPLSFLRPVNILVLVCWGIMPLLHMFGYWDNYLSGSLYSGKLPLMAVCIGTNEAKAELKPFIKEKDLYDLCNGKPLIKLQSWAMNELNVPPYPELRVYRKIQKKLIEKYPQTNCYLYYYGSGVKYNL